MLGEATEVNVPNLPDRSGRHPSVATEHGEPALGSAENERSEVLVGNKRDRGRWPNAPDARGANRSEHGELVSERHAAASLNHDGVVEVGRGSSSPKSVEVLDHGVAPVPPNACWCRRSLAH